MKKIFHWHLPKIKKCWGKWNIFKRQVYQAKTAAVKNSTGQNMNGLWNPERRTQKQQSHSWFLKSTNMQTLSFLSEWRDGRLTRWDERLCTEPSLPPIFRELQMCKPFFGCCRGIPWPQWVPLQEIFQRILIQKLENRQTTKSV